MGLAGISPWSLLLILLIVVVLFGTKKLRSIGKDMGSAVASFREGVQDSEEPKEKPSTKESVQKTAE